MNFSAMVYDKGDDRRMEIRLDHPDWRRDGVVVDTYPLVNAAPGGTTSEWGHGDDER